MNPFKAFEHTLARKLGVGDCPYCHADSGVLVCNDDGTYYVCCFDCGFSTDNFDKLEDAVKHWNDGKNGVNGPDK